MREEPTWEGLAERLGPVATGPQLPVSLVAKWMAQALASLDAEALLKLERPLRRQQLVVDLTQLFVGEELGVDDRIRRALVDVLADRLVLAIEPDLKGKGR